MQQWRSAGVAILAVLFGACGRTPHLPGDRVDESGVAILEPWDTAVYTQAAGRVLAAAFPSAQRVSLARFDQAFSNALARRWVVLLPHAERLPCEVWGALDEFLNAGGCAVLWGAWPFAERVWTAPSGFQREHELAKERAVSAQPGPWPETRTWQLASEPPRPGLILRVASDPALPWPGVQAEIHAPVGWGGITSAVGTQAGASHNALLFYARGDARTPRLQFEVGDGSGLWWRAVCEVRTNWAPLLLPLAAFAPVGGAGPSCDRIAAFRVGVDGTPPGMPDAPYAFGLSDVRRANDPRPAWPRAPVLPGLPADNLVVISPAERLETARGAQRPLAGAAVPAQAESPRGCGEDREGMGRVIPIARVMRGLPERSGVCAQIYADLRPGRALRRYGWIGLPAGAAEDATLSRVLREMVDRLQNGHLILQSGLGAASVREGESLEVHYLHAPDLRAAGRTARVNVELLDPEGRVLRRVSAAPRGAQSQRLDFGRAPGAPSGAADFTLRLRAIDTREVVILDEVQWPLRVFSARDHVPPRRPVEAAGSLLLDGGRPVVPLIQGWDEPSRPRRVLEARNYPAARVAGWLDRAREIGLNTVAVTLDRADLLPQYEHLADELEGRRMRAVLRLSCFPVLRTDWDEARALTRALARCRTDPVLAIDIAAVEPGPPGGDPAWAAAWSRWLAEQFGSLAEAARALGCDTEEEAASAWGRPAAELRPGLEFVLRRCRSDLTSRHFAALLGLLREAGLRHALTRAPLEGEDERDPAWGAAHLDFLVVALNTRAAPREWDEAGFLAAWARGSSGGKPVLWMEQGPAVPAPTDRAALQDQGERWARLFKLQRRTSAAGSWLAAPLDGVPPFLFADDVWRPSAQHIRLFNQELRGALPGQAGGWRDRMVDLWSEPDGWPGLRARWAPRYGEEAARGEWVELRPTGFGVETQKLEPLALVRAGTSTLWREMNAEWTGIEVNGKPVWRAPGASLEFARRDRIRLRICNTGSATWTPWTPQQGGERHVRVVIREGEDEREILRAPRLAMGQSGTVEWMPSQAGLFHLRVSMPATGPWGEELTVRVLP